MPEHAMNYIESDIPVELTLPQWRRARTATSSRRGLGLGTWLPAHRASRPLGQRRATAGI